MVRIFFKVVIFLIFSIFIACNQNLINNKNIDVNVKPEIYLDKSEIANKQHVYFYKPYGFTSNYKITLDGILINNTEQILEKIVLKPSIILDFNDDVKYVLSFDSIEKYGDYKKNSRIKVKEEFVLNRGTNFKTSILKHEIKNAELIINLNGTNSVGYNSNKIDSSKVKIDFTEEWDVIKQFYNKERFTKPQEVISNYLPQMTSFLNDYVDFESVRLQEHKTILNSVDYNPYTVVIKYEAIQNFKDYRKKLFSKFWKNLSSVDSSFVKENYENWRKYNLATKNMFETRELMEDVVFKYRGGGYLRDPEYYRLKYYNLEEEYDKFNKEAVKYNEIVIDNLIEKYPNI